MESKPQNLAFGNNPENFHPCLYEVKGYYLPMTSCRVRIIKSRQMFCWAELFATYLRMVLIEKLNFEKRSADTKNHEEFPSMQIKS